MGFQEKYKEYKQRREAKRYFHSQSQVRLHGNDIAKVLFAGFAASFVIAIIMAIVQLNLSMVSAMLYLVMGYVVADAMTRNAQMHSKQLGIMAIIMTFVGYYIYQLLYIVIMTYSIYGTLALSGACLPLAFAALFSQPFIDVIFMLAGLGIAYYQAR